MSYIGNEKYKGYMVGTGHNRMEIQYGEEGVS